MGFFNRRAAAPAIDMELLADTVAAKLAASWPAISPTVAAEAPMQRTEFGADFPFGPGVPILPSAIDPRDPATGRTPPRRSEFTSSVNLQVTQTRLLPFQVLRDVSERVDVIRRCIELRKSEMQALDWDIVISRQAIKRIMVEQNITSQGKASQIARAQFSEEMVRLRTWWEKPDRFNGQNFSAWLGLLLEEQLVIDAPTLWPRRQGNGEVLAIEILDGSTIKPLIDHRGSTPTAPNPAYQQILYGFPRGDFTASQTGVDDGYTFDQLIYRPRYIRTWTPYGCPNVEQALAAADIYLKRMSWIRTEFTEGTTPDMLLENKNATSKMTPTDMKAWEAALNAELAGQDVERRHIRLSIPGWEWTQLKNFSELFKPDLDEFLIKLICMCFDVMPTEIGFTPNQGIGGKGHQEGEANSAMRKAIRPTAAYLEGLITDVSREWLGMSPELEFKLLGYETEDQGADEIVTDSQIRRGGLVMNEDRAKRGLPLYDFAEADEPFIVGPSGIVFVRGAIAAQAQAAAGAQDQSAPTLTTTEEASATDPRPEDVPEDGDPIDADEPVPPGFIRISGHLRAKPAAQIAEAAKFASFVRKRAGQTWRPFQFETLGKVLGDQLNAAGAAGDVELVKTLVAHVGKARARTVSRADKVRIVNDHAPRLAAVLRSALPSTSDLIDGWNARQAATKSISEAHHEALGFVRENLDLDTADLDAKIKDFQAAGYRTAWSAAWVTDDEQDPDEDDPPSRLRKLWDAAPSLRADVTVSVVALVATALISNDPDANLTSALTDASWSDSFVSNELTASLSAGALDAATAQGLNLVRLAATGCDFCQDYDGRIMSLDDDTGMPPLHRGCQCDIEPLD